MLSCIHSGISDQVSVLLRLGCRRLLSKRFVRSSWSSWWTRSMESRTLLLSSFEEELIFRWTSTMLLLLYSGIRREIMLYLFLFFSSFSCGDLQRRSNGPQSPSRTGKARAYHDVHEEHFFLLPRGPFISLLWLPWLTFNPKESCCSKKIRSRV